MLLVGRRLGDLVGERFVQLPLNDMLKMVRFARGNWPPSVGVPAFSLAADQFLESLAVGSLLPEVKEWILRHVRGSGLEMVISPAPVTQD